MNFLISNWYIILAIIVLVAIVGLLVYGVYTFVTLPTDEQIAAVKEWLLWAVTKAEQELGNGTGEVKLAYVYDMFVSKFSWLAKIISYEEFSELVEEALEKFKALLVDSEELQEYVCKEKEVEYIE